MAGVEQWMKQSIEDFFDWRKSPSEQECNDNAFSLVGASSVRPVGMQGSLSYTVIATTETIISYRVPEVKLGSELEDLAKIVHGDLVPKATFHGELGNDEDKSKRLHIYTMPCIPGKSCMEVMPFNPILEDVTIADPGLGGGVAPPEPYIRVGVPPQVLGAFLSSFLL